jgi:hypothetical protein
MKLLADALESIAVTLWVGGLWIVGLMVAPMLFRSLVEPAVAGVLAGRFFAGMAWVAMGCAAYLALLRLARFGPQALRQLFFWCVLAMAALAAIGHFGIHPIVAALRYEQRSAELMQDLVRDRFAVWHGISSVIYLVQCGLGMVLAVLHGRGR